MLHMTRGMLATAVVALVATAGLSMLLIGQAKADDVTVSVSFAGVLSVTITNDTPNFGSLAANATFGTLNDGGDGLVPVVVTNDPSSVPLSKLTIQSTGTTATNPSGADFDCADSAKDWEIVLAFDGADEIPDEVKMVATTDGSIGGGSDVFVDDDFPSDLVNPESGQGEQNFPVAAGDAVDVDLEIRMDSAYTDAGVNCQGVLTLTAVG